MIPYTVPAVASLLIIMAAVLIITLATRRFLKGEFKAILKWLLIGFWFMAIPYTLFIVREMRAGTCASEEVISWTIYLCMVAVGLCILRAAMLLDRFSRVYGFASSGKKKK